MKITLRPYQEQAISLVRASLGQGNKRIVVALATGGGKSAICEAIIQGAIAKGKRVMFLVNRVQLVDQMSAHLKRAGIMHGIFQSSNTRATYQNVLVASIDTISSRGFPECDIILADESHSAAGSKKYHRLFEHYKSIPIIGVTATPMAKGMGKVYPWGTLFEDIVCPITIPELIEQGYLVDVDIYSPSEPDLSGVKIVAGEYHEGQLGDAVDKPKLIGDIVTHWMRLAKGKQTIAFAVNIQHSMHIVEKFLEAGVSAVHIDYRMEYEEKADIVKRFKNQEFTVLSNCALLSEGFDAPATECMILARPTKSLIRYIQMAGRVLRPSPGKNRAILLDHSGTALRLGFPTDAINYELDDGKPKPVSEAKKKEKEERLPKLCPKCSFLKTSAICASCGFKTELQSQEVAVQDGTLQKLEKKKKSSKLEKQDVYSQLYGIAREKGYQSGWVSHKYREYFDVWPKGLKDIAAPVSPEVSKFLQHLNIKRAKSKNA